MGETALPIRILLAEDNAVNQKVAVRLLQKSVTQIDVVENGRLVLEALAAGHYDVVLMDVQMPEMDGLETTGEIRRRESIKQAPFDGHVQIVAMTAHAMVGDRERCLAAGMDDHVTKPINKEELLAAIRRRTEAGGRMQAGRDAETTDSAAESKPVVLHIERLEEISGGDSEFECELLGEFLKSAPEYIEAMVASIDTDDAVGLKIAAHTLKGSCRTLGADALAAVCQELENLGADGKAAASHCGLLLAQARRELRVLECVIDTEITKRAA